MAIETERITITGIVQGVGFRPFVYSCAKKTGVSGYVANTPQGVVIEAQGNRIQLESLISGISANPPPGAIIEKIEITAIDVTDIFTGFEIRASMGSGSKEARISPDLPICENCIAELLDPINRRYYYPYINCSHCGPRYTIIKDIPYDRKSTTMSSFAMCDACANEYTDPSNRRFHAQPNACYTCGPHIELSDIEGNIIGSSVTREKSILLFERVRSLIGTGAIVAIKGIGGFHLACDATNQDAVKRLRSRKVREAKPFAVMVKNVEQARIYSEVSEAEAALLESGARPIVLLDRNHNVISADIAPRTKLIGIMLPYTPIQYLVFEGLDIPLVMTSANASDEPIAYENNDAIERLSSIADYLLLGNRDIHTRCDDSVVHIRNTRSSVIRRSRGYVPNPVPLARALPSPIIALGAEQKNTICFGVQDRAILSHHIGDLDNPSAFRSFEDSIEHLSKILNVRPEGVAYDLHPDYHNTGYLFSNRIRGTLLEGLPTFGVQHHHAHIASCMADNGIEGKVIGIALDGTGYGPDGTVWGGEILIADESGFTRAASLLPARLPGGSIAIKKPWRMALSYLYETFGSRCMDRIPPSWDRLISDDELAVAQYQLNEKTTSPIATSCGRLFDGVAALAGVCLNAIYEGQPAIELEQTIDANEKSRYAFSLDDIDDFLYISWKPVIENIIEDVYKKKSAASISAKFHKGLADALVRTCGELSRKTGLRRVVLSGGCCMNAILVSHLVRGLDTTGFEVFVHEQVPCNDGGISLGQIVISGKKMEK